MWVVGWPSSNGGGWVVWCICGVGVPVRTGKMTKITCLSSVSKRGEYGGGRSSSGLHVSMACAISLDKMYCKSKYII